MDFDRYRKTEHWKVLSWEAQALLPHVLAMMPAGRLEVGTLFRPLDAIAEALPRWPRGLIETGYKDLIARKLLAWDGTAIVDPTAETRVRERPGPRPPADPLDPFADPDGFKPPVLTVPVQHREPYSQRFLNAWKNFPRKQGKGSAWLAWLKLTNAPGMTEAKLYEGVRDALRWQLKSGSYFRFDDPTRIPHMSTWLNQRRWEDEEEL